MHQRDVDVYASAPLRRLLSEQTRVLRPDLQRCAGSHALLLGVTPGDEPPALPMLGYWTTVHLAGGRYGGDVCAAADEPLPFVDDAFELVMLRHALEVAPQPDALFDEAVRVLVPGGLLVLTGVHPFGAWAPWLGWRARKRGPALRTPWRLTRQLVAAGLVVERVSRVGGLWPGQTASWPEWSGACGGGFVMLARKRRHLVTLIRLKPAAVHVAAPGHFSPSTRRSSSA